MWGVVREIMTIMKRRLFIIASIALLVLLAGSIGLNVFLFNRGAAYYRQLNETRLDPMNLSYYPTNLPRYTLSGLPLVVFYGDSRAADWPTPDNLEAYEFVNRGIGAQTSAQVLHRFDLHVRSLRPQFMVLQVGINDLKTLPLFPERRDVILYNCQDNIRRIVHEAHQMGAKVILTTVFPVGDVPLERQFFWSEDVAWGIRHVNNYIYTLQSESVIVLDAYDLLAGDDGLLKPEYRADLLHMNAAGYAVLNDALTEILSAQLTTT
jgi:lysophospholipase L1-like esterase